MFTHEARPVTAAAETAGMEEVGLFSCGLGGTGGGASSSTGVLYWDDGAAMAFDDGSYVTYQEE